MDERFLFPFEKVSLNSNILIYGAGEMGQSYLRQLLLTKYCNVIGMVDKNYIKYQKSIVKVHSPAEICNLKYDFIVIAIKSRGQISDIKRKLKAAGVSDHQIVHIGIRPEVEPDFQTGLHTDNRQCQSMSWEKYKLSWAVFMRAGIGGVLFAKRPLMEFVRLLPESGVDIYISGNERAIQCFLSDIPNINAYIYNLGFRYKQNSSYYDFAVTINSSGYLKVDHLNIEKIQAIYPDSAKILTRLKEQTAREEFKEGMPRISLFQRHRFLGKNAYTAFDYGILNIPDNKVPVPLPEEAIEKFRSYHLDRYITVNYGNGASTDARLIAKAWPLEYFNKTVKMVKAKYTNMKVIQLGAKTADKIDGVDHYFLGEDFALVEHILKNAVFHLDTEGGLVHLATQLGTKCIVLFGPTPEFYYGYEENINIKVGNCHDCCGVYMDSNRCARGMEKPECMYSITPEIVMERIEKYLDRSE